MLFKCYFDVDACIWVAYQTTRTGEPFSDPITAHLKDHALVELGRQWKTNPDEEVVDKPR